MALRHLAPRFVDWRLSRIDEETDRVSCSSDAATSPPSPPLPPPPPPLLLLDDDDPATASDSSAATSADETPPEPPLPSTAVIYSNADEWRKQQLARSAAEEERDALRFIKEKYDSLGKVAVDKPAAIPAPQPAQHGALPAAHQQQADTVYENMPSRCAAEEKAAVVASQRQGSAECRCREPASNSRSCCGSQQPAAAVTRRELRQPLPHPPCRCHHEQDELDEQGSCNHSSTYFHQVQRTGVFNGWSLGLEFSASTLQSSPFSSVISALTF